MEAKIKEAEQHAEEDKKRKEGIEVKNRAESLVYETEKSLKEAGDKMAWQAARRAKPGIV